MKIDFTRCRGRGACIDLAPEAFTEDEWGFPIQQGAEIPEELAQRIASICPRRAIVL